MSDFELDPRLAADTLYVGDLPLCQVRLMNDAQYPWLILVPRQPGLREPFDLSEADQLQLLAESRQTAQLLQRLAKPEKLNIAAIGNVVSQLHLHHVARFASDASWPAPVWGARPPVPRKPQVSEQLLTEIRHAWGAPLKVNRP